MIRNPRPISAVSSTNIKLFKRVQKSKLFICRRHSINYVIFIRLIYTKTYTTCDILIWRLEHHQINRIWILDHDDRLIWFERPRARFYNFSCSISWYVPESGRSKGSKGFRTNWNFKTVHFYNFRTAIWCDNLMPVAFQKNV